MKTNPFRLIGADASRTCWRVSAIYRCCLRYGAAENWALARLREVFPDGSRDHMVDVWFADIDRLQARRAASAAHGLPLEALPFAA